MPFNTKNIIVGAAALFVSKIDSTNAAFYPSGQVAGVALPAGAKTASGPTASTALEADTANWRNLGYTTDGVEVSNEPDYGEVPVDQLLDSARIFKQGMRMTVNTTLAEASLENLLVAWGLPSSAQSGSTVTVSGGALGDDPVERSIAFVGVAPKTAAGAKQERVYYLRRALQVETTAFSLSRADATTFPVSFRLLPEATVSGSDYGQIIERAVT
jgi:hypothetical protein